ncbi:3-hydroxyacyl-CoA dehydrogenase family protein [Halorarum halophilum]|uniref:3-hydroxyacyl-CoA dehydrogenase family protein n=1 Tax=Halorarum halophilum TaxID=2743090 RepID=A0A7D5GBA1_9EURY|nr:3-hydroxyacyl-CoA dehydrogenase NAD-binding domain-containing protein [Halobaculum halophilum]QLG27346.1 3-hydroxyacyl-CoA dehydrogenase family protein [Halobaculum halophilum]
MIQHTAVVGAGDMGHGFAAHFALHGRDVTLIDHRQSNLEEAEARIREVVAFHDEEGLASASADEVLGRITFTLDRAEGVSDVDFVLETVPEELDLKREVFAALADAAPSDAVLASNTSGIPVTDIAAGNDATDRIVGCHWWYPPYLLEPVEVVRGEATSDATMERTTAFIEDIDREPVVVERDVPGFVWNRVQNAVVRECMHLAAEGVASVEDINTAIRDGYARRTAVIGPFETVDVGGLALYRTVAGNLYPHLSDADEPSDLYDEYLDAGRGGIEDGAGFFEYDVPAREVTRRRDEGLAALQRAIDEQRD